MGRPSASSIKDRPRALGAERSAAQRPHHRASLRPSASSSTKAIKPTANKRDHWSRLPIEVEEQILLLATKDHDPALVTTRLAPVFIHRTSAGIMYRHVLANLIPEARQTFEMAQEPPQQKYRTTYGSLRPAPSLGDSSKSYNESYHRSVKFLLRAKFPLSADDHMLTRGQQVAELTEDYYHRVEAAAALLDHFMKKWNGKTGVKTTSTSTSTSTARRRITSSRTFRPSPKLIDYTTYLAMHAGATRTRLSATEKVTSTTRPRRTGQQDQPACLHESSLNLKEVKKGRSGRKAA